MKNFNLVLATISATIAIVLMFYGIVLYADEEYSRATFNIAFACLMLLSAQNLDT